MGQVFDEKWEVVRLLGEGGQAHTFLVREASTGTLAALKRLKNPNRLPRFEQEITTLRSIDHPRVLRVIDANVTAPKPYLVSEYCELGSLEDQKTAIGELSLNARLAMFTQITDGVAAAHQAGVVHRDLKPSNIFVRKLDDLVVGDFGVCFIQTAERLTETVEAVGARFYMAPELADGRADDIKPASDVYSLGKVLYWLLSGSVFDREDHRRKDRLLSTLYPIDTILQVHQFLDVMIVYDQAERLPNAREVAVSFEELKRRVAGLYPTLEHPPRRCRYCGVGTYKLVGNWRDGSSIQKLGFGTFNGPFPHVLACTRCGHLEMFRAHATNPDWIDP